MKWLDSVKVICSKDKYEKEKVFKGAVGTIIMSEIRSNCFEVVFSDKNGKDYAQIEINIEDLEVIKESSVTNEEILKDLEELSNETIVAINYDNGMGYTIDYWHENDIIKEI